MSAQILNGKKGTASKTVGKKPDQRVTVQNVNIPGYTTTVDATLYHAMRIALLKVLPSEAPGLTQTEIREAVLAHLPQELFPRGAKAGWWSKAVQLDLEAKGILIREDRQPLRWHKRPGS